MRGSHTDDCQFSAPRTFYSNAEGSDSISAGQKLDLIPWVSVAQSADTRVLFWYSNFKIEHPVSRNLANMSMCAKTKKWQSGNKDLVPINKLPKFREVGRSIWNLEYRVQFQGWVSGFIAHFEADSTELARNIVRYQKGNIFRRKKNNAPQ